MLENELDNIHIVFGNIHLRLNAIKADMFKLLGRIEWCEENIRMNMIGNEDVENRKKTITRTN